MTESAMSPTRLLEALDEDEEGGEGTSKMNEAAKSVSSLTVEDRERVKAFFGTLLKRLPTQDETNKYGVYNESVMLQSIVRDFDLLPKKRPVRMSRMFDDGEGAIDNADAVMSNDTALCCYASVGADGQLSSPLPSQCKRLDLGGRVCLDKEDLLKRLKTIGKHVADFYTVVRSV